jgi:hypothetical protein
MRLPEHHIDTGERQTGGDPYRGKYGKSYGNVPDGRRYGWLSVPEKDARQDGQ